MRKEHLYSEREKQSSGTEVKPFLKPELFLDLLDIGDFPSGASGKEPDCQFRKHKRHGLDPGSGRSPGGGHGNSLQYSCLENPMDTCSLVGYSP